MTTLAAIVASINALPGKTVKVGTFKNKDLAQKELVRRQKEAMPRIQGVKARSAIAEYCRETDRNAKSLRSKLRRWAHQGKIQNYVRGDWSGLQTVAQVRELVK